MTKDIKRKLYARSTISTEESFESKAEINIKLCQAKFTVYSHSWDNINDGKEYQYPLPIFYTIDEYIAKISLYIRDNNAQSLENWLKSYFIYSEVVLEDENHIEAGREVTLEKYKIFKIRPLMEILILDHQVVFESLLKSTESKPECHKAIMNSLVHLNLKNAYLSDLNLSQANFSNSHLTGASFENSILNDADFSFAHLTKTHGLTSAQLDSCTTYEKAKLPDHIWPYWDKEIKTKIKNGLESLWTYSKKLQSLQATRDRGVKIRDHAHDMLTKLEAVENTKVDQSFKENFVRDLNSLKELNNHRDGGLKVILANITLCIVGAGIGYLIAGAIHKAVTGRFLFFSRTRTQELVDKVDSNIPRIKCR